MQNKLERLRAIEEMDSITGELYYNYELIHEYDIDRTPLHFQTNIAPNVMNPLIAYIEFQIESSIDDSISADKEDIIQVIDEFYGNITPLDGHHFSYQMCKINQYYNREYWCGSTLASEFKPFKREGLSEYLKSIVAQ